jgi:hypothetical protein
VSAREAAPAAAFPDVRGRLETASAAWPEVRAALLGAGSAVLLASFDGGYFATTWGWTALALSWSAALALLLRAKIRVGTVELAVSGLLLALLAWVLVSLAWTTSVTDTVLEAERLLAYIAAALAALLLVRSRSHAALLAGVWGGVSLVCAYALLTRLFPDRLGVFDTLAANRLFEPVGYWNALGILAALGALLALGLAARARAVLLRALAGGSTAVLIPTLYFTFSRGAWIALAAGLVAAFVLDRRRLQLLAALVVLAPWPATVVWIASHSEGLTDVSPSLSLAARDGHRLAWVVGVLAAIAALAVLLFALAERKVRVPRNARLAIGAALVAIVAVTLIAASARFGSPPALAVRAYDAVRAPPPPLAGDLNRRLFNLSSNARVFSWRVAWRDYEDHDILGSGAGSYEQYWLMHRPVPGKVVDAHSLYLEMLAELGPVGLALVLSALGLPLAGAIKARRHSLVPAAFGAYVAFLAHAAVDWDWEMPVVTVSALFCGLALLIAGRRDAKAMVVTGHARVAALAVVVALSAFAFVALVGNSALAAADAAVRNDPEQAEAEARKAMRWAPWSSEPWRMLAKAQFAAGDAAGARRSLRKAIAKEPRDWNLWYELALASDERPAIRKALDEAARLNPRGSQIADLRKALRLPAGNRGRSGRPK